MKRNKLYTVTKDNKPMFAQGVDRLHHNILDGFDTSFLGVNNPNNWGGTPLTNIKMPATSSIGGVLGGLGDKLGGVMGGGKLAGSPMGGLVSGIADTVGGIGNKLLSNGLSSGAGSAISSIGSTVGGAIGNVNPVLGAAVSVGSQLVGGLTNALWGTSVDQEKLDAANKGTSAYNSFSSNADTFDEIEGPVAQANVQDAYRGGAFKKSWARKRNQQVRDARADARLLAFRGINNNINNLQEDQINNALSQFFAYGGLLGGALGNEDFNWGLNQLAIAREKDNSILPQAMPIENMEGKQNRTPLANMYGLKAFGGELGTNGTDFTNGLIQINEGGTHEMNPLDGVPMGFDDRGIPNLVEEGETVFNDYVFSNRLQVPTMMYNELGLGGSLGKKAMTFAEASKKLAKESEQRPNDPISMDGLRNALAKLAGAQESLKEREEEPQEANTFAKGGYKRRNRITTERYNRKWFEDRAKSLGMDEDALKDFEFTDDVDTNLAKFNDIYKAYQREKARKTYVRSQRQARKNELFDERKGRYKLSDDEGTVYQAKINTDNREGYINAKGDFIDVEAYKALDDEEKKAYRYRKEPKGSRQLDFYGNPVWDIVEGETLDSILDKDNAKYEEGFEWDPKKAEELSYPVEFTYSPTSNLRYAPVFGGFVGLANDLFNSPDYSRADAVINAGQSMRPMMVRSNYNPTYLTYKPMDNWYGFNALAANSRATDRAIMNSGNTPARNAALLANGYNSILGLGNLYRQGLEYNNALRERVAAHNSGENRTMASLGLQAQMANQNALSQAQRYGLTGIITGNQMKDDIDARKSANISANLGNLVNSIGNIGEEAYDMDRLKWLADTGVLRMPTTAAKGGMLKKKRRGCK